jgi:N-acetylmuramoyl-L-alanine amidase
MDVKYREVLYEMNYIYTNNNLTNIKTNIKKNIETNAKTNIKAITDRVHINRINILILSLLLSFIYLFSGFHENNVYAASGFKLYDYATKKTTVYSGIVPIVTLNGEKIGDDRAKGILINGIALLPYDTFFEASAIAADCTYNKDKGCITISKYGNKISMTIGSKKASVNGKTVTLSVAPMKVKYPASGLTKVLVPSRFVAEAIGLDYTWYSNSRTIAIEKKTISLSYDKAGKFEYSDLQTKVTIDGKNLDLGKMPGLLVNNIAMLRVKKVFADSVIGADYSYNKSNKKITLIKDNKTLVMTVGSKTAYLNNKKVNLDNAPMVVTNHETGIAFVMVPGRNTATYLGCNYVWDKAFSTSRISTKKDSTAPNSDSDNNTGENNNTDNNTDNNTNSNSGNGNTGSNNTAPELGDDGVYTEPGTVIKDWKADALTYGRSSEVHELNSGINYTGTVGQVYYASHEYINKKNNSDTFMFVSSVPFGNITSENSNGLIRITIKNLSCTDQVYQLNGTDSSVVNTITMHNLPNNYEAGIELNVIPEDYQYDLKLTADKQTLYITVYKNIVTSAVIGMNEDGDYLTISGLIPFQAEVTDNSGQINITLPKTVNGLGELNSEITGTRYIRHMLVSASADATHIQIIANPGYEYYFIENGNEYSLSFRPQDSGNEPDTGNDGADSGNDGDDTGNDGSDTGNGEPEKPITDKSSYEIIIPRPQNLSKSMITDEDFYLKSYFVIRLKGDYTEFYKNNRIKHSSNTIKEVTVSLNAHGETEIKIVTTKLQGYKLATDSEAICVNMGDPGDIYKNIVVLDPGHGGAANGAQYFGIKEKDINLKILYTLGKKYFNSDTSKLKVYYTRVNDVDMPLSDRAAFVKKVDADLFVSLHMNAAEGAPNARGSEVFYSVKNNSPNSAGLRSQNLAELLNTKLHTALGTNDRGVKTENYTVIYKNTVPAVLIELGFLSNKEDNALLTNETFQDKTAKTIYETLLEVFKKYPAGK